MYFLIGVKSQSWYSKLAEMKKLLILIFVVFTSIGKAQNNKILAFINVKYSTTSGIDDTKQSLEGVRTLIFMESDSGMDFLNMLMEKETHSGGGISNVVQIKNTTEENVYTFDWNYQNTYDDTKGKALIECKVMNNASDETLNKVRITIKNEHKLNLVYEGEITYMVKPIVFYYSLAQCND